MSKNKVKRQQLIDLLNKSRIQFLDATPTYKPLSQQCTTLLTRLKWYSGVADSDIVKAKELIRIALGVEV